jgi:hypothetical protein
MGAGGGCLVDGSVAICTLSGAQSFLFLNETKLITKNVLSLTRQKTSVPL